METKEQFTNAQVRRFLTALFHRRAQRHLQTLATTYGWSPETLAAHEARFIQIADCLPTFGPLHPRPDIDD